jgi:hypothetical protein
VDSRAGLEKVEKRKFLNLRGLELRLFGRPARSQSLYRLRSPGTLHSTVSYYLDVIGILIHYFLTTRIYFNF